MTDDNVIAGPWSRQLTLDGTDVPVVTPPTRARPLSPAQRAILREIGEHGHITATRAGELVHELGTSPTHPYTRRAWRGSDGWSALDRLRRKGLVVNDPDAHVWRSASPDPTNERTA